MSGFSEPSYDFNNAQSVRLEDFVSVADDDRATLDAQSVLGFGGPPEGLRWDHFRLLPRPDHVDPRPQTKQEARLCLREMLQQRPARYGHLLSFFRDNDVHLDDDVASQSAAVRLLLANAKFPPSLNGILDARLISLCFDFSFFQTDATLRRLGLTRVLSWGLFDITLRKLGETQSRFQYHLRQTGERQSIFIQAPFSSITSGLWKAASRKARAPETQPEDLEDLVRLTMSLEKALLIQMESGAIRSPD